MCYAVYAQVGFGTRKANCIASSFSIVELPNINILGQQRSDHDTARVCSEVCGPNNCLIIPFGFCHLSNVSWHNDRSSNGICPQGHLHLMASFSTLRVEWDGTLEHHPFSGLAHLAASASEKLPCLLKYPQMIIFGDESYAFQQIQRSYARRNYAA
jgi:hypothetical protein